MNESSKEVHIKSLDFSHLSADGRFNAIGSLSEYEVVTRCEGRGNDLNFNICYAHQNERSGTFASCIGGFAEQQNTELGEVLIKNHTIQTHVDRSSKRIKLLRVVMDEKNQNPTLGVKPLAITRWCSIVDKSERVNIIMGDLSDTLNRLYAKDGIDYGALTTDEKSSGKPGPKPFVPPVFRKLTLIIFR